jgi:hypothetical protein
VNGRAAGNQLLAEALAAAACGWPVLPGVVVVRSQLCSVLPHGSWSSGKRPVPVADVVHLASTDADTVRTYWRRCPEALVAIATGEGTDALEMPSFLGRCSVSRLRECGLPVPPVVATAARCTFLVSPEPQQWVEDRVADLALQQYGVRYRAAGEWVVLPPAELPGRDAVTWAVHPDEVVDRLPTARQVLSNVAYAAQRSLTAAAVPAELSW